MKSRILALLALFSLFSALPCGAQLADYSFRERIENSQLIGLFKVAEVRSLRARLTPIALYKGNVKGDIWLTGFANTVVSSETFSTGQTYVIFANSVKNYNHAHKVHHGYEEYLDSRAAIEAFDFVLNHPNGFIYISKFIVKNNKVHLDLAEVNENSQALPVDDLRRLVLHMTGTKESGFLEYCKDQVSKNLQGNNAYLLSNYLAMLEMSDEILYDRVFAEVAKHSAWEAKFILGKILGKVKGDQSRDLLVTLVADSSYVVQGEAIRQLARTQPLEIFGPLLIHFDSTASNGVYSSLMTPVRHSWKSGKSEIIKTFRKLKHTPATRHLLPMLQSGDQMLIKEVLDALARLDLKRQYAAVINERLADPELSYTLMNQMLRAIEMEDLVECKDVLLLQLTTHDRNGNVYKTPIFSALATLATKDSTIETALLNDFQHFFSYCDTLDSSNEERWLTEYIKTFTSLASEEARPLIYRSVYNWTGLHPEVHITANEFQVKRAKEDSLINAFSQNAALKKYKLDDVLYLGNANRKFIVTIRLPDNNSPDARQKSISEALHLRQQDLYFVSAHNAYYYDRQNRFDKNFNRILKSYCEYAVALPTKTDLMFINALLASDRWEATEFKRELSEAVLAIETALRK